MRALLAYDGRQQKVLDYAISHALAYKSPLFIISALATKDAAEIDTKMPKVKESLENAKQKAAANGLETHTFVGVGDPASEIIATAERIEANVIILGRSDKTPLDRVLLGSTSEHVLRHARCTVIFVQ
jgi:nucleotide-binding universal stress UspA family protein